MRLHSSFLLLALFIISIGTLQAQETTSRQREIGISAGLRYSTIHEARFSNQTKRYLHPSWGLHYAKWNHQKRETLDFQFSTNGNATNASALWLKLIHTQITYTYQRKAKNTWVGGYFASAPLFFFPQNDRGLFGNNPISYTITNSIGLAVNHEIPLWQKGNQQIQLDFGARTALLSHVIRPLYAHPYPEHYFQEGVFHPTREGLAKSIHHSGKVRTLNKYQSLQLRVGLNYALNNNWNAGLSYTFSGQYVRESRPLSYQNHDLRLKISYRY